MTTTILFIHGAGDEGYAADQSLVSSLSSALGKNYPVLYPEMETDESRPDFGWMTQIAVQSADIGGKFILVGHSLGASMLLRYLSDCPVSARLQGVFLLAAPFWHGDEEWKSGLKLKEDFAAHLPAAMPIYLYHCRDDQEVPFSHLSQFKQKLPGGIFRDLKQGGHQFDQALTQVVEDILALPPK